MPASKKRPGVRKATPVHVDEGIFVTVGVPRGPAARVQLKRAVEILRRAGYRAAITSDDAIHAAAEILRIKDQDDDERTETQ